MKAGPTLFLALFLLATATAQCTFSVEQLIVDTEPGCPNGEPLSNANVYVHEQYHICGKIDATGTLTAYEPTIMQKQTVQIINNAFELQGNANTNEHKVYYIQLNHTNCQLEPIRLEVKDRCDQVAPSVRVLPENSITQGSEFTIEIANLEKDFDVTITGLENEFVTPIHQNGAWSEKFNSSECCDTPPCQCIMRFSFVDAQHPICQDNSTTIKITVKQNNELLTPETENLLVMTIIGIIILIGTALAIFINREK